MVSFRAAKMTVSELRRLENMMSDVERSKAYTDYVAMMSGIELPTIRGDEVMNNGEQNERQD